jgi:hypothetical protein
MKTTTPTTKPSAAKNTVILTPNGFVVGYCPRELVIVCSPAGKFAKRFASPSAAKTYVARWADCGYGLNSKTATIEKLA